MDASLQHDTGPAPRGAWRKISVDRGFRVEAGTSLPCPASACFLDLFDAEGRAKVQALLAGTTGSGPAGGVVATREGVPLELVLIDQGARIDLLYRDITNEARLQERLAVFYRHFLTTPIAIIITDLQGAIVDANRSFLELYGYRLDEVLGQNPRLLKSGRQSPAAYREMWEQIADEKAGSWTGEIVNRKKSGEEVTVLLTVSAVRKPDGTLIGYIASALDITRKKHLELELQASNEELRQLSALKSDFMAITSHDLKAPINSIISRVRLIRELGDELPPQKLAGHLDRILDAGASMTAFINDFLDLEKIESGRFQLSSVRVHLDAVLRSCVETNSPTAETRGIGISFSVEGSPEPITADVVKMEQVFNNLLSNAIKFAPAGSVIEAAYRDPGPGLPKLIEVADRGPGIPDEEITKIFDKYYQVKKKDAVAKRAFGTGLGLNIVRNIVELHGGTIRAANRAGGGCLFTVEIPGRRSLSSGRDMAALVADPEAGIFRFVEGPLANKGVSCFMAATVEEARRLSAYEQPELVLVEARAAADEFREFIEALRNAPRPPLIVAIGSDCEAAAGVADQCLVTPVVDVEIYELLREVRLNRPERVP